MEEQKKILIVDDEPEFVTALRTTLEAENFEVSSAGDRAEAERAVRQHEPDALILGTIMPRGNQPRSPPWSLLPGSVEYSAASAPKVTTSS